jgi:sec-independent protein translocase protein TatA
MGLMNPLHLAFVAVIALVVLGPKRLPEIAKSLGNGMRELRDSLSGDHDEPRMLAAAEQPPAPVPPIGPTTDA